MNLAQLSLLPLAAIFWYLFIPPLGFLPLTPPTPNQLPPDENAAVEYALAVEALPPPGSPDASRALIPDQLANIYNKLQPAFHHLKAGAARKQFRTLEAAGNPLINPRNLCYAASFVSQALAENGQLTEALDLALAAYTCGSAWSSDPDTTLVPAMIGVASRRLAGLALFQILSHHQLTNEQLSLIAHRVERDQSLPLTPDRLFQNDFNHGHRESERRYLEGRFRGFDRRFTQGLRRVQKNWLARCQSALARYDVQALKQLNPHVPSWIRYLSRPLPHQLCAGVVHSFFVGNLTNVVHAMALDQADARGLVALASILAYQIHHQVYPPDLTSACGELDLPTPTHPPTGRPIAYRQLDHGAEIWLPGLSGIDHGGLRGYDPQNQHDRNLDGRDLIYPTGRLPSHIEEFKGQNV